MSYFYNPINTGKYSHYSDSVLYRKIERILSSGRFSHPTQHKRCIEDISDMLFAIADNHFLIHQLPNTVDIENLCNKAVQKAISYLENNQYNDFYKFSTFFNKILESSTRDALRSSKSGHNRFSAISINANYTTGEYEGQEISDIIADDNENIFDQVSKKISRHILYKLIAEYAEEIHKDFEFVCDILCSSLKPKEIAEKYSDENDPLTAQDIYPLEKKYQKDFKEWLKHNGYYDKLINCSCE